MQKETRLRVDDRDVAYIQRSVDYEIAQLTRRRIAQKKYRLLLGIDCYCLDDTQRLATPPPAPHRSGVRGTDHSDQSKLKLRAEDFLRFRKVWVDFLRAGRALRVGRNSMDARAVRDAVYSILSPRLRTDALS